MVNLMSLLLLLFLCLLHSVSRLQSLITKSANVSSAVANVSAPRAADKAANKAPVSAVASNPSSSSFAMKTRCNHSHCLSSPLTTVYILLYTYPCLLLSQVRSLPLPLLFSYNIASSLFLFQPGEETHGCSRNHQSVGRKQRGQPGV